MMNNILQKQSCKKRGESKSQQATPRNCLEYSGIKRDVMLPKLGARERWRYKGVIDRLFKRNSCMNYYFAVIIIYSGIVLYMANFID